MASFFHQLKVLLWKNWLSVRRQPVWSVVLILWPVCIFFILAIARSKFPPSQASDCYRAPRNLQSTGMVPFLLNVLCDTDTTCSKKSYLSKSVVTRSRLKKRSVDTGGGGSEFHMTSSSDPFAALMGRSAEDSWSTTVETIKTLKLFIEKLNSGDPRGAVCSTTNWFPSTQQTSLQNACMSNKTLANLVVDALFPQANNISSAEINLLIISMSTMIQPIQNNEALWNFLLMLPEYIKNLQSFPYSADINLNISNLPQQFLNIQTCMKNIMIFSSKVQNLVSSGDIVSILQTLSNQNLASEIQSCLPLFQMLPCGSGCQAIEQTQQLVNLSFTNGALSNACNSGTLVCSILNIFLQSPLAGETNTSSISLARYIQLMWTLLKQNGVDQMVVQMLQQQIYITYPLNLQLQGILMDMVNLLVNATDNLITASTNEQYFGILQTLLEKINILLPPELLSDQLKNNTYLMTVVPTILNDLQYWMNLSSLLSSSDVPIQALDKLQNIVQTFLTISTEIAKLNDTTTLLQALSVFNQTGFQDLQQRFQNLFSLTPAASTITETTFHAITLLLNYPSANNSFILVDFYLKQILQLLNTDTTLQNVLALLNPFINGDLPSPIVKYAADILSFFTPSNLEAIGSNPKNASMTLFSFISKFFPSQDQEFLYKAETILKSLFDSVFTCQMELTNCSSTILRFQQQLIYAIQSIPSLSTGDIPRILQMLTLSDPEITVVNNLFSTILCSQKQGWNNTCNNAQDVYKKTLGELSNILNMALSTNSVVLPTLPALQLVNQNIENVLLVLSSVDLNKISFELYKMIGVSICYSNAYANPLKCNLDFTLNFMDFLLNLPFPKPLNDTLFAAFSVVKNWLGHINGTADIFQQLIDMNKLTNIAFQNQLTLQEMKTSFLQIVQTLEYLMINLNSTSLSTGTLIRDLLQTVSLTSVNFGLPPLSTLSPTNQELENIKNQLQIIRWYIVDVKNELETLQSSSDIKNLMAAVKSIINGVLSSMKNNYYLVPSSSEIQYIINWLENSPMLPVLQNILNMTLQGGSYSTEMIINHIMLISQQVIQQELLSGGPWNAVFNGTLSTDSKFILQLIQEFNKERLSNLSSVLIFIERSLLVADSFLKDVPKDATFLYTLQTIQNISKQIMDIAVSAQLQNGLNESALYDVIKIILDSWTGTIFKEFPNIKTNLTDLLSYSMQCITVTATNCSSSDILHMVKAILANLGCNISKDDNVTLDNILGYALKTSWEGNLNGCVIENANIRQELACFSQTMASAIQQISTLYIPSGINSSWIQEINRTSVLITGSFSSNNISCVANYSQIMHITYQIFANSSSPLQSLISQLVDQEIMYSSTSFNFSQYLFQVYNILKLYDSMHGEMLLNDNVFNIWYNKMLQFSEMTWNFTNPSKWLMVSSMLNAVSDFATYLNSTGSTELIPLISTIGNVMDLTNATLTLNEILPPVSLINSFSGNFSAINNNIKQLLSDINITSSESCESSLQSLLIFYQSKMNVSFNTKLYSNLSLWTCSMIFSNNSGINWLAEVLTITNNIITSTSEAGLPNDTLMNIVSSFFQFVNNSSMDSYKTFLTYLIYLLQPNEPQMNPSVYQSLQAVTDALQTVIKEIWLIGINSSVPADEEITISAVKAAKDFLAIFNITGSEEIVTFASDILQIYFNYRNSTMTLENFAQKVLGDILTSFQESGLEKFVVQTVENQILSQSSMEQNIIQHFLNILMLAINETASDVGLQPPSFNNNLVFNILKNIVNQFNSTVLQEVLNQTSDPIQFISLAKDVTQLAENWNTISVLVAFPQNRSDIFNGLETWLNGWLSQNIGDKGLYFNFSTALLETFYIFVTEAEKLQAAQNVQQVLAFLNQTIAIPTLVSTLENLYDIFHLNDTNTKQVFEVYFKQLENLITSGQVKQGLSEIAVLLNTVEKMPVLQTNELSDAALAMLPFLYPPALYNISSNGRNITSVLLNILINNLPPAQQLSIKNTTIDIISLIELIENCSKRSEDCVDAVFRFETLAGDIINAVVINGTIDVKSFTETLIKLEKMTELQVSFINSIFSMLGNNNQSDTFNFTNIYQEVFSLSQVILNISSALNGTFSQQNLAVIQKYLEKIRIVQNVTSTSNITHLLLQIQNINMTSYCTQQDLFCTLDLTSKLLRFLQNLQKPGTLMDQLLSASSIIDYWKNELDTTGDVNQHMSYLYNLTQVALQEGPVLNSILSALTDISQTLIDIRMKNTSFPVMGEQILALLQLLPIDSNHSSITNMLNLNNTQFENIQSQIHIIQWYIMHLKNQTERHNTSGEIYALYRLTQITLTNLMPAIENMLMNNFTEFLITTNLSADQVKTLLQFFSQMFTKNQSNTTLLDKFQNWVELAQIAKDNITAQELNTFMSYFTSLKHIISNIMEGQLPERHLDEIIKALQGFMFSQNVTIQPDIIQVYDLFLGIVNQTFGNGPLNLTQLFSGDFSSMDCQGYSKIISAIYKIIQITSPSTTWPDDTFISNITIDMCHLLMSKDSQTDFVFLLNTLKGIATFIAPLVQDSARKYVTVAEYIITVAVNLTSEPAMSQNSISSIASLIPVISELFSNISSLTDWTQNNVFQKIFYFLLDLTLTSSSDKDLIFLKTQNLIMEVIREIQKMLTFQNGSPFSAWMSFAVDVIEISINSTQNITSQDRLLKAIWDSFNQNGLQNVIISTIYTFSNNSEMSSIMEHLIQHAFNITNMVIYESQSGVTTAAIGNIMDNVLNDFLQILLTHDKNLLLLLNGGLQPINVTVLLNQLDSLITSVISEPATVLQFFSSLNEAHLFNNLTNILQLLPSLENGHYINVLLDALNMFNELVHMNNTSDIQTLSTILTKYLTGYLDTSNQTQGSLSLILNTWQHFATNTQSSNNNKAIVEILQFFQSQYFLNNSITVDNMSSWFSLITQYIPAAEIPNFENTINASLLLFQSIQACHATHNNCTGLIEGIHVFLSDVAMLVLEIQNSTLGNNSFFHLGSYNQSQVSLFNEVFFMMLCGGSPYKVTNRTRLYEDFLALTNWLLNSTTKNNLNMTLPTALEDIVKLLASTSVTQVFQQTEFLLRTYMCTYQLDADPLFCKLNVISELTQLLNLLYLPQTTNESLDIISSITKQWLNQINTNVSVYQQINDLYNTAILAFQYQPAFQAINTSLVNIVKLLQEKGLLLNTDVSQSASIVNLLSEIIQKVNSQANSFPMSSQFTISQFFEVMQLELDTVNWLIVHVENQTQTLTSSPGTYTMHVITQWLLQNSQQITLIIRDLESVISSFKLVANSTTGESIKTMVEDILKALLSSTTDFQLRITLQMALGVVEKIPIQNTITNLEMFITILKAFAFQGNTSNYTSSVLNIYSNALHYNINNLLENIQLQLDTVKWLLLLAEGMPGSFNSSSAVSVINTGVQWLINNSEQITLIIKDVDSLLNSFNSTSFLTDLLHIFRVAVSDDQIQGLIQQGFMNISVIKNLFLNQSIQKDAETALLILQNIESNNISSILTSISQVLQIIQGIKEIDLASQFYTDFTVGKVFTVVEEGMGILNNIATQGTIGEEAIYRIYNFTYFLIQGEWNWVPFHNISATEAQLLDIFYLTMKPFLGGNGAYIGNCSAQEVLQILLQTITKNTTSNLPPEKTTCDYQLIYNTFNMSLVSNHSLGDMIYLAIQNSPVLLKICGLQTPAEEVACLMQVMGAAISILADLNKMSGLQIPLIRILNNSLDLFCNSMPGLNSTILKKAQLLQTIFVNQSNPIHAFIQLVLERFGSSVQTSDLQQIWTDISLVLNVLATVDSNLDAKVIGLVAEALNLTAQPKWSEFWNNFDSILSKNWTVADIDASLAVLDTLKRALSLIDSGLDVKTIQIYQSVVLLLKNSSFVSLFDLANSEFMNTTMSSAAQCVAVARFSYSIWSTFDPTHAYLYEELLFNISQLACNSLFSPVINTTIWISELETLKYTLSYLSPPALQTKITNYFTGLEKVVVFASGINSSNISQSTMLQSVYTLFIQELRIFSNSSFIADWMENIQVSAIIPSLLGLTNNVTEDQIITVERDLFFMLSRIFNASSMSDGFSKLSYLVEYLANSTSSQIQATDITQQFLNLMTTFTVGLQTSSLAEPYGTVIGCLENATQDISSNLHGHLEEAIQLARDLFTQSNETANAAAVPDLLKQKISQLKNLTSMICGLEGNTQSSCYIPCQYLTLLLEVSNLFSTGIKFTQTDPGTVLQPKIIAFMTSLWTSFEDKANNLMSSLVPQNGLSTVTSLLNEFNITSDANSQVSLRSIFRNSSRVESQLSQIVKLNQASISALMDVKVPENKTKIVDWFIILYHCSTNQSLVAAPLQVFCNLSAEQGYQMTIIFLENVDVSKIMLQLALPASLQSSLNSIMSAISMLENFFNEVTNILKMLNLLINVIGQPTTRVRRSADTSTLTFNDLSKIACNGSFTNLTMALYSLYPTLSAPATNRNSYTSQLYGISSNNSFCTNLFTNLVMSSNGPSTWMLLKPLLYGQILYTPNTPVTQKIMEKTNMNILQVEEYKTTVQNTSDSIKDIQKNFPMMQKLIDQFQTLLNNTEITGLLENFSTLNITDLKNKLTNADSAMKQLASNMGQIDFTGKVFEVLANLLSCMNYNRLQGMNTPEEMAAKVAELQQTNQLFAAVTFNLSSGSSRQKRAISGLPKQISYSISMRSILSENTDTIRDSYWLPGPHNTLNKYSRGFVYLQENIDRAIIEMHTNKSMDNVGVQYQPMPYPCYTKDNFLYSTALSLPVAMMITWVLFIAAFVKKLVLEKELRLHEYMKMMGVNSLSHFFAWFIESASFMLITVSILVIILKFGKILYYSNGFILFLFFLDYSLTVIAMSFFISVLFHNTNVAALSGSLIYIITFFPFIGVLTKQASLSFSAKTLLCLFSPTALSSALQYVIIYEEQGQGMQWSNMYASPMLGDYFNFGWLCWLMLIDAAIYFLVGWYIKVVFPGRYGVGAVWYFPFLPSFWAECFGIQCSKKPSGFLISNINIVTNEPEKKGDELYPYNEKEPTNLTLGVSLYGLTKIFNSKPAVQNLNLNIYEGHVTSLLGHNGAGKTTTLSMLTGLFSASSGTIYVYGEDIRTHLSQVRKNMGVCMQYDVLFEHLTTKEHLLLYGSIKVPQWDKQQLHREVKRTLKETGLYSHRHKLVKALSGGMRRKLSICIAFIGGSKVIILDEPTTGVDPCSRRSIWEVISKNKIDKTIILSTHHLDEAEILSDRIAFLQHGGLRCCGSPMFLKEKFGSGYRLILTKKFPNCKDDNLCNTEKVSAIIQSHMPQAKLKEDVGGELVYVLPPFTAEIASSYLSLLRDLDSNMNELSIGCYGISDTTIEEVFLKLTEGLDEDGDGHNRRAVPINNNEDLMVQEESTANIYTFSNKDDQPLTVSENVKGIKLLFKKIGAIFVKRFHNSKRNWKGLISQMLLPVLFVIGAMGLGSLSTGSTAYPKLLLSPELYGSTDQSVAFGLYNESSRYLMDAMSSFPGIDNFCINNTNQCLSEDSLGSWTYIGNQTPTYGSCNCSSGSWVCRQPNASPPHRMTFSKQMMYNITGINMEPYLMDTTLQFVQQRYGGWSFGLPTSLIYTGGLVSLPENLTLSKVWYNNEGPHSLPAFLNSFSNFLLRSNLPSREASQYSISVYNEPLPGTVTQGSLATTLVNTLVALSVLVGYSITTASFVTYVVKEYEIGSKRLQHIAGVGEVLYWVTNFLYDLIIYLIPVSLSIAMIAAFKLPAFYDYPNLGGVSLLFILFGFATFPWMYLLAGMFRNAGMAFITYVCINLFIGINTIISSSVIYMMVQQRGSTEQGLNETYSALIGAFKIFPQFAFGYGLIQLSQQQALQDQYAIYGNTQKANSFQMDILGYMFVALAVQGTFCFLLRLIINDGIIYSSKTFFKRLLKLFPYIGKNPDEDEDVQAERDRVESGRATDDLLVLQGLTKVFHQVNKNVFAVNNMSLAVPPGECFGLLGVNGAGKTTTFKMLTGEISPSSGNIQVRNYMGNLENVLGFNTNWSSFGYCPQEDALDELMTGEEHLYYYARLHGIRESRIKTVTHQLLQKLQLVQYKDRITSNYSCGTRRKLSTALALIGRPSILLLDEPSSGMDPKTKRHLWKIIAEEIQEKCAVVLTSHSMEECEALCTRLAIMVKGKFQCIGSLQHLKSRFGRGFTVKMHLKDSSINVEQITSFMHIHFPNTFLKEQHLTMVEYHVPVSVGGVASIFDLLETNKTAFNITHFSVSQTTLDEVFINFAQAQASPENSSLSTASSNSSQDIQQVVVA